MCVVLITTLALLSSSTEASVLGKPAFCETFARIVPEHWSVVQCEMELSDVCFVLTVCKAIFT